MKHFYIYADTKISSHFSITRQVPQKGQPAPTAVRQGFTLIELLVVISIISLLASVLLIALKDSRIKARDARRAADMDQIYRALNMYYDQYGCLPITTGATTCAGTGGYSEANAGGWDYSSQGGFMTFLANSKVMAKVPVDPVNNMTGDASPAGTFAYRYYCYPSGANAGLHLGYYTEQTYGYVTKSMKRNNNWSDDTFKCK